MSPETLEGIYFKFASKAALTVNYDGSLKTSRAALKKSFLFKVKVAKLSSLIIRRAYQLPSSANRAN